MRRQRPGPWVGQGRGHSDAVAAGDVTATLTLSRAPYVPSVVTTPPSRTSAHRAWGRSVASRLTPQVPGASCMAAPAGRPPCSVVGWPRPWPNTAFRTGPGCFRRRRAEICSPGASRLRGRTQTRGRGSRCWFCVCVCGCGVGGLARCSRVVGERVFGRRLRRTAFLRSGSPAGEMDPAGVSSSLGLVHPRHHVHLRTFSSPPRRSSPPLTLASRVPRTPRPRSPPAYALRPRLRRPVRERASWWGTLLEIPRAGGLPPSRPQGCTSAPQTLATSSISPASSGISV